MLISKETASRAIAVHEKYACPRVGHHGSESDICFLALALGGEAGEAANIIKKGWRDGKPIDRRALAEEIAGTACYLVGLASAIGLDLDGEMNRQMDAFEARYR